MAGSEGGVMVSAGDLEKFSYCPLSWWLSTEHEVNDEATSKGITEHERLGRSLWKIDTGEKAARQSETLVLWYAIVATVIAILGLELLPFENAVSISRILGVVALIWILAATFFLYKATKAKIESTVMAYEKIIVLFAIVSSIIAVNAVAFLIADYRLAEVLELISLVWLIAASYFLYRSLKSTSIVESLRKEFRVDGKIEYIDVDDSKMFISKKHGLQGRPDYVIKVGEHLIPVEEKKGRTPHGPLYSHTVQVSAYCMLIEDTTGKAPPYGLLKYPEAEHQVEYNDDMRRTLLAKLEEMRKVKREGKAHRDHSRPGKCRSCSRRNVCPERLA